MSGRWSGTVDLGSGWLCYQGPIVDAQLHAHHAIQVIKATEPVTLADADGASVETCAALIPANARHRIRASGQTATLIYLEPPNGSPDPGTGPRSWAAAAAGLSDAPGLAALVDAAAAASGVGTAPPGSTSPSDPQVQRAQELVRARLPEAVRLVDVAAAVTMSPSRLTHRFTAAAGIPFRRWVLWERLQLAGNAVACGADLTEAAHQAGFADSAHLNRTFRKMFGITPSDVTSAVTWRIHP